MSDNRENVDAKSYFNKKGTTRHCCYGTCNSDSRYADRPYMQGVDWIPFPKPGRSLDKCQRWVNACGRQNFTINNVKKWTYICSKHFVGGKGPTTEDPDPIPATFTPQQVERFSRKRKAPTPRSIPLSKKQLFEVAETMVSLQDTSQPQKAQPDSQVAVTSADKQYSEDVPRLERCSSPDMSSYEVQQQEGKSVNTVETQTTFVCSDTVASKIERIVHINNARIKPAVKTGRKFSYETLSKNEKQFKFYTGLTVSQFNHLFSCLGETVHHLIYWKGKKTKKTRTVRNSIYTRKVNPKNQMLLTLMKLRQAFPNKDLAYRFDVSLSTVSEIINTWIQFLYKQTEGIRERMFPSKEKIKETLPPCFRSFKNVRVVIDCFEVFVQSSRNFAEQGNSYSSYKHHTTLKCLVGISPVGGVSFMSDVYEGSISDRDIFIKSNLASRLEPGDLVIADRGFFNKRYFAGTPCRIKYTPIFKWKTTSYCSGRNSY